MNTIWDDIDPFNLFLVNQNLKFDILRACAVFRPIPPLEIVIYGTGFHYVLGSSLFTTHLGCLLLFYIYCGVGSQIGQAYKFQICFLKQLENV